MARWSQPRQPLRTLWEVPEPLLWQRIEPMLKEVWPQKRTGRRSAHGRQLLNGLIFRMRTGCPWDPWPRCFGPQSTGHGWFQRWVAGGVFEKIWAVLVTAGDGLPGVEWNWPGADGMLGQARFGGTVSAPTRPSGARARMAPSGA